MGDCHLGGWRQPELKELNFEYFKKAIQISLSEKVEFILISGDLFDSAYPPMDTLKNTFEIFRNIKDANIPVFIIAGSHDYSVSGNSFLDVLEKAGFCKNVSIFSEKGNHILLEPTIFKNVAIFGFPGKRSGLEVEEISRIKLQDAPGLFRILMLHTTIRDAVGNTQIDAVDDRFLPKVDYLALSHLHIKYCKENRVYSGPIFPNSITELEELGGGSFYIYENGKIKRQEIKLKEVFASEFEIHDTLSAGEKIFDFFKNQEVKDKIVILRLSGMLDKGNISEIDFENIEKYIREKGAFSFLKSTSKIHIEEPQPEFDSSISENVENEIISSFLEKRPTKFNKFIHPLIKSLQISKLEDETNLTFEDRLISETKKTLEI